MNFIAATEGLLPASYYAFNRASIDFPAALQTAEKLCSSARSTSACSRSWPSSRSSIAISPGFAQRLGNIAWLVSEHWEAVNPRPEGDDDSGRIAQLMTLEDNAVVLLPLQYAPLLDTNREGVLCLSRPAAGDGRGPAALGHALRPERREADDGAGTVHGSANAIARVLSDVEIGKLASVVETFKKPRRFDPVDQAATTEHVGFENGVELPKLAKLVG